MAAISQLKRNKIYERDSYKCLKCGATGNLTIDHITSLSNGGNNIDSNLQTLCEKCNKDKATKFADYRADKTIAPAVKLTRSQRRQRDKENLLMEAKRQAWIELKEKNKESNYLLQKIDCNCNDCKFLQRHSSRLKAHKLTYEGTGLMDDLQFGFCIKQQKEISFIPNICQLETQKCFEHRKD